MASTTDSLSAGVGRPARAEDPPAPPHQAPGGGELQRRLTEMLYEQAPPGLAVTAVNGILVTLALSWAGSGIVPWIWLAALLLLLAARLLLVARFREGRERCSDRRWSARFAFGAGATGLAWGLAVLMLPAGNLAYPVFLGFVVSGMVAGAIPSLSPNLAGYRAYLLSALVPFALYMAHVGGELALTLVPLVVLFGAFMWVNAGRYHEMLVGSLRLGQANLDLVTDLTRERDRIASLNARLEAEVAERGSAQEELLRAKEQAESASVAKSQFVANMSHEIRTPMNGVLGMIEMLGQTQLDTQQRGFLDIARNSAESLLTIINDILDFSKIEAGKIDLESIPFDLRILAEDVATLFIASAQSKGIELACFVEPSLATRVIGDPTRVRQVLTNILGNAVKFTEHGEVLLRVSGELGPDGVTALRFEIRDTGIGMTPEQMARVFMPFQQADGSTTRRFGGSGLGLVISRNLAELMGGRLELDSELGRGSVFTLHLALPTAPAIAEAPSAKGLDGVRMLAVDDHPTNLEILAHYLRGWGVDVECLDRADQGLARLHGAAADGQPFRIAILDMQMPGMDGLALAAAIRAEPLIRDTRLLLLSSGGNGNDPARQTRLVDFALNKPVRQGLLRDALCQLTHGAPAPRPEPSAGASAEASAESAPLQGRVLLAEDNPINQKVACGMLRKLGLHVDLAGDGREALERIAAPGNRYDLVLMDVQMPEMDGFTATSVLRSREQAEGIPRIPVIAMTANAMSGDRELCIAAGMDDYIPKPVRLAELRRTLANWIPGGQALTDGHAG